MKVYEQPVKDHIYCLIADVSRGKGLDYSAFHVIDVTVMPYKQVFVYRDNTITPIDYAGTIHNVLKRYNDAYTLVEINDIGGQVTDLLHHEFECETMLLTEHAGRSGKRLSTGFSKNADKGIRTTKSVKAIGCNMIKMLVEQDQIIINDFDTINEFSTFSRKGQTYQAESGRHDDLVMGLVLFGWMADQPFFKEITDINTVEKLKQRNDNEMIESLLPIGFNSYDHEQQEEGVATIASDDDDSWLL